MNIQYPKPLLGFAAWSGTGKTTLLVQVLPLLKQRGLRIAMLKHAHHNFDVDQPGKDSYELRKAGASTMLISSSRRTALMLDKDIESEPDLQQLLGHIPADTVDLVLVEGFKQWPFPKIELYRKDVGKPLLYPEDRNIIAIADDGSLGQSPGIPRLDINQPQQIADFILQFIGHPHG
jgi:molybdopterin-guanine dinucleotide biosynthesis protein MobB